MPFLLKIIVSAVIIATVSELGKKYTLFGALLASLPLTSLLALSWLHVETKDATKVADLSTGILLMVIPSLVFFVCLSFALRRGIAYWPALGGATVVTVLTYTGYTLVLGKIGVQL